MKIFQKLLLTLPLILLCFPVMAQTKTNFNNKTQITDQGYFDKPYPAGADFEISAKNIPELVSTEKVNPYNGPRPFKIATPVSVDLDIVKLTKWKNAGEFSYGKYSIKLNGALSASINFDNFYLPKGAELYVYNENGNMVTGPITEIENNTARRWGSWVYKGGLLNIEIKTPISTFKQLVLHANNVAYGYKEIYKIQPSGFGESANCHINVICDLGLGWEGERNSVAMILGDQGSWIGSGAMIMNTCGTNRPFFLTAYHNYDPPGPGVQDVSLWRFIFQAWSQICKPSQESLGQLINGGSELRAKWSGSDFCLVELNQTPAASSNIHYAGWSRNTGGITQTTIIHHPQGDVMKITRDNQSPVFSNFRSAECWQLIVTPIMAGDGDFGATENGSSGAPYFDQNHRIIGQHYGTADESLPTCEQAIKFGGRFDISWTGGGSNSTRLSNWLDPINSNQFITNTTNVSNLTPVLDLNSSVISGKKIICDFEDYSILNLPPGAIVTWSIPGSAGSVLQLSPNVPGPNQLRITNQKWYQVSTVLTATISNLGCGISDVIRTKDITNDNSTSPVKAYPYFQEACYFYNVYHPSQSGTAYSNYSPTFVHQGCMVYVDLGGIPGIVSLAPGSGIPLYWNTGPTSHYPNTLYFQLPLGSGGVPFTFNINETINGACFDKWLMFFSYPNNEGSSNKRYFFTAVPNPVKDILTIMAVENKEYLSKPDSPGAGKPVQFSLNIYDINTNTLQMTSRNIRGSLIHQLNISSLKPGYHILKITEGNQSQGIKFLKE